MYTYIHFFFLSILVPLCYQVHSHRKRMSHRPLKIAGPAEPWTGSLHCARQTMSLFAVTCIETSHYVSFVKHGPLVTDWLFFDSMADREGKRSSHFSIGSKIYKHSSCTVINKHSYCSPFSSVHSPRRRKWLQHPPGESLPRGGALPQPLGGGAEQTGRFIFAGTCPPLAL